MKKLKILHIGFTLLELLIVISILGLISLRVFFSITDQYKKARDVKRKYDLAYITRLLEDNLNDTNCYPGVLPICNDTLTKEASLNNLPCDPTTGTTYAYVSDNTQCSKTYELYTNLEYIYDPSIDVVKCKNGCGPQCQYNYGVASSNTSLSVCPPPTPSPSQESQTTGISIQYVCAPGGGKTGNCVPFEYPLLSDCPLIFPDDPTCQNQCKNPDIQCKNASGKTKPEGWKE